jgi:hypothetical protein
MDDRFIRGNVREVEPRLEMAAVHRFIFRGVFVAERGNSQGRIAVMRCISDLERSGRIDPSLSKIEG